MGLSCIEHSLGRLGNVGHLEYIYDEIHNFDAEICLVQKASIGDGLMLDFGNMFSDFSSSKTQRCGCEKLLTVFIGLLYFSLCHTPIEWDNLILDKRPHYFKA